MCTANALQITDAREFAINDRQHTRRRSHGRSNGRKYFSTCVLCGVCVYVCVCMSECMCVCVRVVCVLCVYA
jgi:hypothetical protein